jgi:hypothetical protein
MERLQNRKSLAIFLVRLGCVWEQQYNQQIRDIVSESAAVGADQIGQTQRNAARIGARRMRQCADF